MPVRYAPPVPFTPSHAVVAIPFARTPLPAVGVAAGAMAPDLPIFLPGGHGYSLTHQAPFFPLTGLALGLLLVLAWRVLLRPWARVLMPAAIAGRLPEDWSGTWRDGLDSLPRQASGAVLLLAAIEIGVVTHVVWDAFSHVGRLGARLLPVLDADGPLHVAWASWVQYASSVLGLLGIVIWATLWLRRRPARTVPLADPRLAAAVWGLVAAAAIVGAAVAAARAALGGEPWIDVVVAVLTGGIGAAVLALVLAAVLLSLLGVGARPSGTRRDPE
ncbi:hypothetical protein B5808_06470 [Cnuibacter physcomitrellae]|uniref:Cell wall anchor protein n=1 Tax=Cnuibacter physcomitrellae TaxID=1619308 RepID=A0A1X9LYW6_9MICO|nr:hypothetical protein B5808_06470 [Cnuibacter physcomitrellae]